MPLSSTADRRSSPAVGVGVTMTLPMDVRLASDTAKFGFVFARRGIVPEAASSWFLPRLVGPARAKDICFTGRFVGADEALRIGLVDEVVPAEEVYDTARKWAAQFASGPMYALRAAKEAIDQGLSVDLATGLAIEAQKFASLFATEDRTIGMDSFIENGPGKATFVGR